MRILTAIFSVVLALALAACNSTGHNYSASTPGEPANVVIYRPGQPPTQAGAYYRLFVNGSEVGKLENDRYIALHLPQGEHVIKANDPARTELNLQVQAGKTYWLRGEVVREPAPKLALTVTTADDAVAEMNSLRQLADNVTAQR